MDIWTYRDETALGVDVPRGVDIVGFSVEAVDGGIGKIDEATYDVGSSYVVVDTGPWIFGKKVMLPAGVIERIDHENKTVFVDRTKDEIKSAPGYEEHFSDDLDYRGRLGEHYDRARSLR
jgi:hypothetical protein